MAENKKISVIVAAAGSSTRLGNVNKLKQFFELNGKPLLFYSLDKFIKLDNLLEIVLVTNDINETNSLLKKYLQGNKVEIKVVLGGSLRQESVFNGFKNVDKNTDIVVIHDVARPLFDLKDLHKCIDVACRFGTAILSFPVIDTIKKGKYDKDRLIVQETIDREELYQIQTPQVFQYKLLDEVYKKYCDICVDKPVVTDEAKLVELLGGNVDLVIAKRSNIKITYPEDLEIASALLRKESKMSLRAE